MRIYYDKDRDYAEVFFCKEENYGEELNSKVTIFKSEKNDKVVGYAWTAGAKLELKRLS